MVTKLSLAGQKILVTRPAKQAAKLVQMIQSAGGEAIVFPVIEIQNLPAETWLEPSLSQQDWLIFVSRNAVEGFVAAYKQALPQSVRYAAIGEGTAETMRACGLPVDLLPVEAIGSEGLLKCAEFQHVSGQNISIIRGKGGRELLADTLAARGANMHYIEVYQRGLPAVTMAQCKQAFSATRLICTSIAGVDNLCELLDEQIEQLKAIPLLVLSERISQHAIKLGFSSVAVTATASDEAIMASLMEMNNNHG